MLTHLFGFIDALPGTPSKEIRDTRLVDQAGFMRQRSDTISDLLYRPDPYRSIDYFDPHRATPIKADRPPQLGRKAESSGFADMSAPARTGRHGIDCPAFARHSHAILLHWPD